MDEYILVARGVTKKFGEFIAVNRVDYKLKGGEIACIIGPNGAGKTTLINLLSGFLLPDEGKIFFKGRDITYKKPHTRAKIGILRTFQLVSTVPSLTVSEYLQISLLPKGKGFKNILTYFRFTTMNEDLIYRVKDYLEIFGLDKKIDRKISELSYGEKRKLEILGCVVQDPEVLLLDEPLAGLSEVEADLLLKLIADIHREKGLTILIVEHKISKVVPYINRLSVMAEGKLLIEGKPDEVINDKMVKKIYWGVEE
ncbi:MAG: ABC transporter ATP-binding protein [Desulfurococcaceae archaeon]